MKISRHFQSARGVSAVELAITLPLILVTLIGSLDVYSIFSQQLKLKDAVQTTAFEMAKVKDGTSSCPANLEATVLRHLSNWGLGGSSTRLSAEAFSGALAEERNAFVFSVELGVSCFGCVFFSKRQIALRANGIVMLDPGNYCYTPLPWGEDEFSRL